MTISVTTDLPVSDDLKARIPRMVKGEGRFDYRNRFTGADGEAHDVVAVHFLERQIEGVAGGDTKIVGTPDGPGAIEFRDGAHPAIYLEDETGALHGWNRCREETVSSWHYGTLFADEAGDVWFCGREQPGGGEAGADEPVLLRVANEPAQGTEIMLSTIPAEEMGTILTDDLPCEGEFWLSRETPAVVTSIPWIGSSGLDEAQLARLRERAQAVKEGRPDPALAEDLPTP